MATHECRWARLAVPAFPLFLAAAATGIATQGKGVPVGDVEVWGTVDSAHRAVEGALRVHVRTPFGRIPITGHARATYACDASFGGALSYGALVRFFASLRRVDLVSQADGAIHLPYPWECDAPPHTFRGRVDIQDTVLVGFLRLGDDSIPLHGRAWTVGDSTYHTNIEAQRARDPFTVQLNLYER